MSQVSGAAAVPLVDFLAVAALLFGVGLWTSLRRTNAILILMGVELMLNAVNLNLVAFSLYHHPFQFTGQILSVFSITVTAAESAVGLAIILNLYRQRKTVEADALDILKH